MDIKLLIQQYFYLPDVLPVRLESARTGPPPPSKKKLQNEK